MKAVNCRDDNSLVITSFSGGTKHISGKYGTPVPAKLVWYKLEHSAQRFFSGSNSSDDVKLSPSYLLHCNTGTVKLPSFIFD